jgi:hypothetical protein
MFAEDLGKGDGWEIKAINPHDHVDSTKFEWCCSFGGGGVITI